MIPSSHKGGLVSLDTGWRHSMILKQGCLEVWAPVAVRTNSINMKIEKKFQDVCMRIAKCHHDGHI